MKVGLVFEAKGKLKEQWIVVKREPCDSVKATYFTPMLQSKFDATKVEAQASEAGQQEFWHKVCGGFNTIQEAHARAAMEMAEYRYRTCDDQKERGKLYIQKEALRQTFVTMPRAKELIV